MINRLPALASMFLSQFGYKPAHFFQSTGRMELLGNHTDHQGGSVLVAAIDMTMYAAASKTEKLSIVLLSEGYPLIEVALDDLSPRSTDFNRTSGIIRGIAARMKELGYVVGGLAIAMNSSLRAGSGVSSSAAIELLIAKIMSCLYNDDAIDPVTLAKIAQHAENIYFGKPSGLLDQMGIALGGINYIEFLDFASPAYETVPFPFDSLHFLIINTGGSHTDLTHHYVAVKENMMQIARHFDKRRLIDVNPNDLQKDLIELVRRYGARMVNRALHFFQECERVRLAKFALIRGDATAFIAQINGSGLSSEQLLQNITYEGDPDPKLAEGLAFCRSHKGMGAVRVHGGGFAGTILAVIKDDEFNHFQGLANDHFGKDNVTEVHIIADGLSELSGAAVEGI